MSELIGNIPRSFLRFLDRHSIFVATIVIAGYYVFATLDLFQHTQIKKGLLEYILRFDSLIFMWVIAAVVIQLQKHKRERQAEEEHRKRIFHEYERQRAQLQMLDEFTMLLQDTVNNPLAAISITTHNLRKRFASDMEVASSADRIEASLQRINGVIRNFKAEQTQKIVGEAGKIPEPSPGRSNQKREPRRVH